MEDIKRYQEEIKELSDLNRELKKRIKETESANRELIHEVETLADSKKDLEIYVDDLESESVNFDNKQQAINFLANNNLMVAMEIEEFINNLG